MKKTIHIDNRTADDLGLGLFRVQISPRERLVGANKTFSRLTGLKPSKDNGHYQFEQIIPSASDRGEFLSCLKRSGHIKNFQVNNAARNKKAPWLSISATLTKNGHKEQYVDGIIQNISVFQEKQDQLSHEIDVLQGFLDSMPDAIYFKDRKNRITKVNTFYAKGFKMSPKDVIGKTDFDFFPREQAREMTKDDNFVIRTGKPIIGKIERTLLPNKTWNQVITTKVPIFAQDGKIVGSMGITRDMTMHANLEKERFGMMINALTVLGKALEMRDPYTFYHTRHVATISEAIAKEMGFSEDHIVQVKLAAELHDLGKISIPLDILIKPGKLTDLEFNLVKKHVDHCYFLIKDIKFPFPLAEIVYQHHERLDGSGYPRRLKGPKILMEARIIAVSDVLEAMTSHRPYRAALGLHKAVEELKSGLNTKYDINVVRAALAVIKRNGGIAFWKKEDF